ncbi:MAG: hypothetical protein WBI34_09925, partial [Tenuifilaceae bacterium]
MNSLTRTILNLAIIVAIALSGGAAHAQYFGQNKPIYKNFKYNVYESPNFEFYHYFQDDSIIIRLAQAAEQWYA